MNVAQFVVCLMSLRLVHTERRQRQRQNNIFAVMNRLCGIQWGVFTLGVSTAMAKAMAMALSWNGLDTYFAMAMAMAMASS